MNDRKVIELVQQHVKTFLNLNEKGGLHHQQVEKLDEKTKQTWLKNMRYTPIGYMVVKCSRAHLLSMRDALQTIAKPDSEVMKRRLLTNVKSLHSSYLFDADEFEESTEGSDVKILDKNSFKGSVLQFALQESNRKP